MADNPTPHPNRGPDITPADTLAARGGIADTAATRGEVVLLDVREPNEWAAGHAPGARHISLGDLDPSALDAGVAVIAICRSGNRSGKAADALAAAGFRVRNMSGGMNAWQQQGLPVVRDDGSAGTI